jgi:hypothetical protein
VSCATPSECVSGYTCLAGACYPAHALRIPDASARVMVRDTAGLFTDAFTWETWAVFASSAYSDPTQSLMQVVDINPGNPYALVYLRALYNSFDCVVGTGTGFTIVSTPLAGISTASRTKSPARAPRPSRCSGSMASA